MFYLIFTFLSLGLLSISILNAILVSLGGSVYDYDICIDLVWVIILPFTISFFMYINRYRPLSSKPVILLLYSNDFHFKFNS